MRSGSASLAANKFETRLERLDKEPCRSDRRGKESCVESERLYNGEAGGWNSPGVSGRDLPARSALDSK